MCGQKQHVNNVYIYYNFKHRTIPLNKMKLRVLYFSPDELLPTKLLLSTTNTVISHTVTPSISCEVT